MFKFFDSGQFEPEPLFDVIAALGEFRYLFYELKQLILTEGQEDDIYAIRKEIIPQEIKLDVMERVNPPLPNQVLSRILTSEIEHQEKFWPEATEYIDDAEQLELALQRKDKLGLYPLWLEIIQLQQRLYLTDICLPHYRLRKSDINCRLVLRQLIRATGHENPIPIAPEDFFWRQMK